MHSQQPQVVMGLLTQAVKGDGVDRLPGGFKDELVAALEHAEPLVHDFALFDGLVRAVGVDFEGSLAVHPVVSAAEAGPFRADHADVVGREALTERAGVVGMLAFVGHVLDPGVARGVNFPRLMGDLVHLGLVGVKRDLDFIHDRAEILVVFSMQDGSDMLQGEASVHGGGAHPDPGDVALSDVHDALGVVDQVVNLAFQDGFEVFLELAARHFHVDGQRQGAAPV